MSAIVEIESTKAKAGFASLPERAKSGDLAITRHGRVQAYVLSPERYAHLAAIDHVGTDLMQTLDGDFESLVTRMQSPVHARAVQALVSAPLEIVLAGGDTHASDSGDAGR